VKDNKIIKSPSFHPAHENGKSRTFNFEKDVKEFISKYNMFHDLLNPDEFRKVKLNKQWNTLEWENGFDICPSLLQSPAGKTWVA
jgi:hypothetical protein